MALNSNKKEKKTHFAETKAGTSPAKEAHHLHYPLFSLLLDAV